MEKHSATFRDIPRISNSKDLDNAGNAHDIPQTAKTFRELDIIRVYGFSPVFFQCVQNALNIDYHRIAECF
jgi:hypothetical protein